MHKCVEPSVLRIRRVPVNSLNFCPVCLLLFFLPIFVRLVTKKNQNNLTLSDRRLDLNAFFSYFQCKIIML